MRPHHHTLDRRQVHKPATEFLQRHVPLRDSKRKVTMPILWSVLLVAAAKLSSIHDVCKQLRDVPCDESVRIALYACLPDFAELQRQLNRALAGRLPKSLRKRSQRLALDLTLIPYHGEPFHDPNEVYRSQAKCGTSHFHAYATAYVVYKGQRYTVALTTVAKGEAMKDVVQRLLKQARSVGIAVRLVLLGRGFYSVDVIRYMQAARYPFLMPAVIRGLEPDACVRGDDRLALGGLFHLEGRGASRQRSTFAPPAASCIGSSPSTPHRTSEWSASRAAEQSPPEPSRARPAAGRGSRTRRSCPNLAPQRPRPVVVAFRSPASDPDASRLKRHRANKAANWRTLAPRANLGRADLLRSWRWTA